MRALVLDGPGRLTLRERPDPKIERPDDVLISVQATGICGTDLNIVAGHYAAKPGVVLGHETTGTVAETGPAVTRFRTGDRVVLDPTFFCGTCFYCSSNRPNYCEVKSTTETGVSHDGTFAPLHVASEAFLHALPDELTFEEGVLTEPLACALHALSFIRDRVDARVLVIGAGPMGLLFRTALATRGFDVSLAEVQPYRISAAREITTDVMDLSEASLAERAERYDLVVDTSGRMLETALPWVNRGGEVLLIGLDHSYEARIQPSHLTDNGIRLIGSIDTNRTFAPALSLLRRAPAFRKIVTHCLPLDDYASGFELLGADLSGTGRGAIKANKVVLCP